ncbi:ADP-ribosylglycohydrolase [Lachnospiraceae bacterium]|nr:ADP-ribosylglycohydrolase [Lachnospiraceae bacterium]
MYGAMLGDIIGSPYEFSRGKKTKVFPLYIDRSRYTDDSLMATAVAEALMDIKERNDLKNLPQEKQDKIIKKTVVKSILKWANNPKYEHVKREYGANFRSWLNSSNPKPYKSKGNGSAMRVAAVGWLFDTLEETERMAKLTAEISHNHPEGIKGAQAVAAVIFLARKGTSKEDIKKYITQKYKYNLDRTLEEIRPEYKHTEICEKCIPQAITCFLEGNSCEDTIRNAVSLAGDTDTNACIAGSMAEAFYGVPSNLKNNCRDFIEPDMLHTLNRFTRMRLGYKSFDEDLFQNDGFTSPEEYINQMQTVGDFGYKDLINGLKRHSESSLITEREKSFVDFSLKAVKAGYPVSDITPLWDVRNILSQNVENESEAIKAARESCEKIFDSITSNKQNGSEKHLTETERLTNMNLMKNALLVYSQTIGDSNNPVCQLIDNVAAAGLDERIKTGLTPADRARMAETPRELMELLDSVDPSSMPSSRAFKNLKTGLTRFVALAEQTDFQNEEQAARYHEERQKAIDLAEKYISYKNKENVGSHKRSEIEYKRITIVEAILERLDSDSLSRKPADPAPGEVRDMLNKAYKDLTLNKNQAAGAAVLYAVQTLKEKNQPLTRAVLENEVNKYKSSKLFGTVVKQIAGPDMKDFIQNGTFKKKYINLQAEVQFERQLKERRAAKRREEAQRKAQAATNKTAANKTATNKTTAANKTAANKTAATNNTSPTTTAPKTTFKK